MAAMRRFAEYLIERGMVDYVGTDLHRSSHLEVNQPLSCIKDYLRHRAALDGKIGNELI